MQEKKTLYIYGDSNTYGYDPLASIYDDARLPEKKRWPTILGEELKPYIQLIEDGQNGRCLPKYD
jgi:lysophospholipase L1-like esterase